MSIRSKLSSPLQVAFRSAAPAASVEGPDRGPGPLVELTVYSGDSLALGHLALTAARVTDLMNDHESFEFMDTLLRSLDDGRELSVHDVLIARDEIFAVAVSGPRGDPKRRTRTRPIPVELRVGRYDVTGNIHVVPGTDPIIGFRRRRMMVPLTEATIEYDSPDGRVRSHVDTILVNRDLADWIAPASRSFVRPPELESESAGRGLANDVRPGVLAR